MRCVHCGKEVKNNIIFCIHCGRPIKHEYSHYACEYYDSLSIWDKIFSTFSGFLTPKKNYRQDVNIKRTTTANKKLKDTIKKSQSSINELYNTYIKENSGQTKDAPANEEDVYPNVSATNAEPEYNGQDPKYFGLKDIKKITDSAKSVIGNFSESSQEEKSSLIKFAGIILTIILALVTTFIDTSHDDYSYDDSSEVYEETDEYGFPQNPAINSEVVDSINSCPLGSENFIIDYLGMLYDDTYQMQWYGEPLYSVEEFQPYVTQIEEIEQDYDNNANYLVYEQLIAIKKLWQELIQPIYENPENFDQQQIDDNLNEFSSQLNDTCNYYLQYDF